MQIKEIQIDGFGVFSNDRVNGLASGLNVIYGPNEFGKTTLLEFIRRMMFGFPKKSQKVNQYQPINGGSLGGVLKCVLASGQLFSIIREAENKDGPIVRTESFENRGQSHLDSIFGHATKEIFMNLYAFTIDELHDIQSLRGEEIKSRVYGAGMGLGEVSLNKIEKELDKNCGEIFKPRGMARIGMVLNDVNKIENEIRQAQGNLEKFDELNSMASRLDKEKSVLKKEIGDLELTKKIYETRLEFFPVVVEILSAMEEISRIENVSSFPENGVRKLHLIQLEKENLLKRIQEEERSYDELKINLRNMVVNNDLLEHEGDILFLQQSLKEVQSVIVDQVKIKNEREQINAQIIVDIGTIAQGWTEEKIMGFELNEIEKNKIQEFYNEFSETRQSVTSAKDKLDLHQEQKKVNTPIKLPVPWWKRQLPYWLSGVGLVEIVVGIVLGDYILPGLGFAMLALGGLLYNKFLIELKRYDETPDDDLEISLAKCLDETTENREMVFTNWRSWLVERDLDRSLTPLATEKLDDRARNIRNLIVQRDGLDHRLSDMAMTIEEVSTRVQKIVPSLGRFTINSDIPTNIQVIARHSDEARLAREKREALTIQCQELIEKIDKLKDKKIEKDVELSNLLQSAAALDEKDFIGKHNVLERRDYLSKIIEEKKGYVQSRVGLGAFYDRFVESVGSSSQEENQQKMEEVSEMISELNAKKDRLLQVIGETRTRIDQLISDDDLSKKQIELELGRQKMKKYAREWAENKIALHMLRRGKRKYEKERQPSVIRAAEKMFIQITQGNYTRIFRPLESDDIFIVDGNERAKGILEMSRGTREQLYLAMRFGLIEEYEARSEPLPIIMDDVFVNFDDDRNDQMIDRVKHFAESRQVIVLTCHNRTLEAYSSKGANAITFG